MLRDLFSLFPAYAGVIPEALVNIWNMLSFPRIRGGDPRHLQFGPLNASFSPHTRG